MRVRVVPDLVFPNRFCNVTSPSPPQRASNVARKVEVADETALCERLGQADEYSIVLRRDEVLGREGDDYFDFGLHSVPFL